MRWAVALILSLAPTWAIAQKGTLQEDFRLERTRLGEACKAGGAKKLAGCAIELFTDHPLHVAAGSMPPQNGFALGGAFVAGKNTEFWRTSYDLDAVGSFNSSFRAGAYAKFVHTPPEHISVHHPRPTDATKNRAEPPVSRFVHPYTQLNLYAQSISLNQLFYFGLGNNTALAGQSVYGMSETIVGVSTIKPVFEWSAIRGLNLAVLAEANGRFVSLRGKHDASKPSIGAIYNEATAPGLNSQPATAQFGEGLRIKPSLGDHLQLNYLASFQQYAAPADSHHSFLRWTTDFNHTFSLYGASRSSGATGEMHGPDECAAPEAKCPSVSHTRNLNGAVGLRLLLSESMTSARNTVPFYFQPTMGGSDINGSSVLASYQDYRFRAPNLLLLRENFEHSIWGPFGIMFMADQGKVAVARGDIGFNHLKHSFAGGLTLRAGGFPMVSLLFAWGGEQQHNIFSMNSSLLGGSARPSLF